MQEFIEKNGIRINDDGFICLSDLIKCVVRDGKTYKNTSLVFSTSRFRIWLECNFGIAYNGREKSHKLLKRNALQKTTGAKHTKATWLDPRIFEYAYNEIYLENKKPSAYRLEHRFIETLRILLDGIIEFEVQKKVFNYRVDIYFPDINLCVEFDEKHHDGKINSQQDADRQTAIEMALGCNFLRVKENEYMEGINKILRELNFSY